MAAVKIWYYIDGEGVTRGPLNPAQLQSAYFKGSLADDSYVWNGREIQSWTPLNQCLRLYLQLLDYLWKCDPYTFKHRYGGHDPRIEIIESIRRGDRPPTATVYSTHTTYDTTEGDVDPSGRAKQRSHTTTDVYRYGGGGTGAAAGPTSTSGGAGYDPSTAYYGAGGAGGSGAGVGGDGGLGPTGAASMAYTATLKPGRSFGKVMSGEDTSVAPRGAAHVRIDEGGFRHSVYDDDAAREAGARRHQHHHHHGGDPRLSKASAQARDLIMHGGGADATLASRIGGGTGGAGPMAPKSTTGDDRFSRTRASTMAAPTRPLPGGGGSPLMKQSHHRGKQAPPAHHGRVAPSHSTVTPHPPHSGPSSKGKKSAKTSDRGGPVSTVGDASMQAHVPLSSGGHMSGAMPPPFVGSPDPSDGKVKLTSAEMAEQMSKGISISESSKKLTSEEECALLKQRKMEELTSEYSGLLAEIENERMRIAGVIESRFAMLDEKLDEALSKKCLRFEKFNGKLKLLQTQKKLASLDMSDEDDDDDDDSSSSDGGEARRHADSTSKRRSAESKSKKREAKARKIDLKIAETEQRIQELSLEKDWEKISKSIAHLRSAIVDS